MEHNVPTVHGKFNRHMTDRGRTGTQCESALISYNASDPAVAALLRANRAQEATTEQQHTTRTQRRWHAVN
jgi:hypothetical protein